MNTHRGFFFALLFAGLFAAPSGIVAGDNPATQPSVARRQYHASDFTPPPEKFSRAQIQTWVDETRNELAPGLNIELLETHEWMNYFANEHFTPLWADPHGVLDQLKGRTPADLSDEEWDQMVGRTEIYNYNWDGAEAVKGRGLATAELTETGAFKWWWQRCNFFDYDEATCRNFMRLVLMHEYTHYMQWRTVMAHALSYAGVVLRNDKGEVYMPRTLDDVQQYPAVTKEFMRIWSDVAHYQCREVEVYSLQLPRGDFPASHLGPRTRYMAFYAAGCALSPWAAWFQASLTRANAWMKQWSDEHPDQAPVRIKDYEDVIRELRAAAERAKR